MHRWLPTTVACLALALPAAAQQPVPGFPNRPLRLIVPYAPGGPTDTTGRIVAMKLGERFAQNVVVDNRPGASGMVGGEIAARSAPDGYTLLLCANSAMVNNPLAGARPSFEGRRDLAPLSLVVRFPYIFLTRPDSGITSVRDLVAAAKAKPGTINYGSAGTGTGSHLSAALLGRMAGIDIVHIPYKGDAAMTPALMANEVQMGFMPAQAAFPLMKSGKIQIGRAHV